MSLSNIFRTAMVLLTIALNVAVAAFGCSEVTSTCTAAWLTPQVSAIVTPIFLIITLMVKAFSQGGAPLEGLFNKTVAVVPSAEARPGVVTPAQVEAKK